MNVSEIANQFRRFGELGVQVENSGSNRVTILDETGEQVPTTTNALVNELASGRDISFQLWIDTSTDVYCRFHQLQSTTMVQAYGLSGLTPDERLKLQGILCDAFGRDLAACEALVVDLYDRTELVDWDMAVTAHVIPPGAHPDLVVMRQRTPTSLEEPSRVLDEFRVISHRTAD
jgi:hypothetical protein